MGQVIQGLVITLHALLAWVLVEIFVNNAYRLSRKRFIFFHYTTVVAAFALVFLFYFSFFSTPFSIFVVSVIAMGMLVLLEIVVFGYLYSGDRWFFNYVDWIVPMFLAWSMIYAAGKIMGAD